MEWTEEAISKLRALWAEGHSTAEIGRRMGISKNAVVGKAHRLELPPRPSPIRREGQSPRPPRRSMPRRISGPTLPSLAGPSPSRGPHVAPLRPDSRAAGAAAQARPEPAFRPSQPAPGPSPGGAVVPPAAEARPAVRPVTVAAGSRSSSRQITCCWPIGEPGTPGFRFCDGDALIGKPYCGDHAALAYVKVRDRREEAA